MRIQFSTYMTAYKKLNTILTVKLTHLLTTEFPSQHSRTSVIKVSNNCANISLQKQDKNILHLIYVLEV